MLISIGKRLLITPIEVEEKKESIIILPKKKEYVYAQVMAIGSDVDENLEVGDLVTILEGDGVPVIIEGIPYISMTENQILGAFREEKWEEQ